MEPFKGMRVIFDHLMLPAGQKRTGIIEWLQHESILNTIECSVSVDFLPEDGEDNPSGKIIHNVLFFEHVPKMIPASHWQWCCPLEGFIESKNENQEN